MSRWFRVYSDLVDDPKFIKLGPDLRSALLMFWCVASANNGSLPPIDHIAIKFRLTPSRTKKLLDELENCGFIDRDGEEIRPHNWDVRQFKSDTSNERVRLHRKRQCNVTRNVTVTPPDTDTDTDTDKKKRTVARAARSPARFDEFFGIYPKKIKRKPAEEKYTRLVKSGIDEQTIIDGVTRFAAECRESGTEEKYIPAAPVWLNQERWRDYESEPPTAKTFGWKPGMRTAEEVLREYAEQKRETEAVPREGAGVRPESKELVRNEQREPGMRSLGQILRPDNWGKAAGVPDDAEKPGSVVDRPGANPRVVR